MIAVILSIKVNDLQKQPSIGVLIKKCSESTLKFTGEQPCRSVISIKLQSNYNEITLRHGCSPVKLLYFFRALFSKDTYGGLLLDIDPKLINQKKNCCFNILQWLLQKPI